MHAAAPVPTAPSFSFRRRRVDLDRPLPVYIGEPPPDDAEHAAIAADAAARGGGPAAWNAAAGDAAVNAAAAAAADAVLGAPKSTLVKLGMDSDEETVRWLEDEKKKLPAIGTHTIRRFFYMVSSVVPLGSPLQKGRGC